MPVSDSSSDSAVGRAASWLAVVWRYLLWIALAVSFSLAVVSAVHRIPWSDEGWFSSASYNLAKHGFMGTTVMEEAGTNLTRIQQRTYWVTPLFPLGQALWYMVFPTGILSTRMYSILWALVALLAFRQWLALVSGHPGVAKLGAALLALSYIFLDNAAFGRPDMMCAALGLSALALYLRFRERDLRLAMLAANTCLAASGLSHPNGIYHFFALCVLVLWYDRRRLTVAALLSAAAPYLVGAALWGSYIAQDPQAFLDQMRVNGAHNSRWTATWNPALVVWNEIRDRYLVAFGFVTRGVALLKAVSLFAYLCAIAAAIVTPALRRRPWIRLLLALLAVYFVALAVFNQKLNYYLIHILPVYIALLSAVAVHWWTEHPRLRVGIAAGLALLVAIESGGILLRARERSYRELQLPAVQHALALAKPEDRIVGSAALIYEFGFDPRLRDDPYLGLKNGLMPDLIVMSPLYRIHCDELRQARRPELAAIESRLSSYRLAFRNEDYAVYVRPNR